MESTGRCSHQEKVEDAQDSDRVKFAKQDISLASQQISYVGRLVMEPQESRTTRNSSNRHKLTLISISSALIALIAQSFTQDASDTFLFEDHSGS